MPAARYWDGTKWTDLSMGTLGGQYVPFIVGDGAQTSFGPLRHALGSRNVVVTCFRNVAPYDEVEVDVERTDLDNIVVRTFPYAPAVGELTVVVAAPGTQAALNITMDSWHNVGNPGEPAYQNGWVHVGAPNPAARFRKFPDGKVSIEGGVKSGTTGTTIFTLPVGYRPPFQMVFPAYSYSGSAIQTGAITVSPGGAVAVYNGASAEAYINCEFDTESVLQTASVAAQGLDPWHVVGNPGEPAFQNSWAHYESVRQARFRKYPDGKVRIQGIIKGGSVATVFTLPVGYRPAGGGMSFVVNSGTATGTAVISVMPDGTIVPAGSSASFMYLDGIEFDTETVNAYVTGTFPYLPVTMDSWHMVGAAGEPAFGTGWTNLTSNNPGLGFRKGVDGRVSIKGAVQIGAGAGGALFTLPVGYRPINYQRFTGATAKGPVYVDVSGGGIVAYSAQPGFAAMATNDWLDVSMISFDTETVAQVASNAAQPIDSWHLIGGSGEPAFQNSWVNQGAPATNAAGFRKFPDGRVRLKGQVLTGAASTVVFTLPFGYRPPSQRVIPITTQSGTALGFCSIDSAGSVLISGTTPATAAYLDGVEFDTESVSSYATGLVQLASPARVTSLPVAPVDGQEVYYVADAANGILWHLRYNAASASAYKWEFVGGSSLQGVFATAQAMNAGWIGNVLPAIIIPLAGEYMLSMSSSPVFGSVGQIAMAAWSSTTGQQVQTALTGGGTGEQFLSRAEFMFPVAITAGVTLALAFYANTTGHTVGQRYLSARPVRVG